MTMLYSWSNIHRTQTCSNGPSNHVRPLLSRAVMRLAHKSFIQHSARSDLAFRSGHRRRWRRAVAGAGAVAVSPKATPTWHVLAAPPPWRRSGFPCPMRGEGDRFSPADSLRVASPRVLQVDELKQQGEIWSAGVGFSPILTPIFQ